MEAPQNIPINETTTCGELYSVTQNTEYKLVATGISPAPDCSFTFRAEPVTGSVASACTPGLCFMFGLYGRIDSPLVTLSVETGTNLISYSNQTKLFQEPVCMENRERIKVLLTQQSGYTFSSQNPGYKFQLSVYHHCGEKGQVKNIKFEEAIRHAEGYHHGEEKDRNEKVTFITGICVGFGMACCFLLAFAVAVCVTRNSPKRGTSSYAKADVKPKAIYKPVAKARV